MIKVNFATTAPQFTKEDDNRRLFKTQTEKLAWKTKHFANPEQDITNPDMETINKATIKANFDDLAIGRNTQYLYFVIDSKTYYYFVDSVTVVKADTDLNSYLLQFDLSLDVITTYLDDLQFKGSTKVKRTHWDRFVLDKDGNKAFNFNQDSALWNNEPDIAAKPTVKKPILDFNFTKDSDKTGVQEYLNIFNMGGVASLAYGTFTPKITANQPVYGTDRVMPYHGLIVPVFGSKEGTSTYKNYYGKDFGIENHFNSDLVESSILNAIHLVNLPLSKHWEGNNDGSQWYGFKNESNNKNDTWALRDAHAEYDLSTSNPLQYVPTNNNVFNVNNEPKLFSSQYTEINILSYTGEKVLLINEYLDISGDILEFNFKEDILSTETVAHFDVKSYRREYSTFDDWKIDFINRDELPTMSSAYVDFVQGHSNAFKTGMETNRIKGVLGGLGAIGIGSLRAASTGNEMGLVGAAAGGIMAPFMAGRQEKMYKAQIQDLKNSGDKSKSINGSVISNWDNLAYKIFEKSDINFGIEVKSLSEIDKYNVAMHFNKYGYETEKVFHLKDISELERRKRFTYWECSDIANNIVKGSVPKDILEEITTLFANGLRLWAPDTDINNYEIENWEL